MFRSRSGAYVSGIKTDAQSANTFIDVRQHAGNGFGERSRVVGVAARYRFEHDGDIADSTRHGTDMIHRFRKRKYAIAADPSIGRLQTHNAVCGGRETDGASRV